MESPDGYTIEQAIELQFAVTNNQAEYEIDIAALELDMVWVPKTFTFTVTPNW